MLLWCFQETVAPVEEEASPAETLAPVEQPTEAPEPELAPSPAPALVPSPSPALVPSPSPAPANAGGVSLSISQGNDALNLLSQREN